MTVGTLCAELEHKDPDEPVRVVMIDWHGNYIESGDLSVEWNETAGGYVIKAVA